MAYLTVFFSGLILSFLLTPVMRFLALRYSIFDHPSSEVKTHRTPTPYLGGLAIFFAFMITLVLVRFFTNFPTGTLRALRGIVFGSILIVLLGLADDLKLNGLNYKTKFFVQILISFLLIWFDIRIKFISPSYLAYFLTIFWVVGIINALNIIDIMDGLAGGIAAIASLSFFFIALLGEEIYVNYASIALTGACLGFLPYNLSQKYKIFMGDAGSLFLGFLLAAFSLGTYYTRISEIALYAPVIILAIPIYDTLFVMYMRIRQGRSPFLGSKDHFALRLEAWGLSRKKTVLLAYLLSLFLALFAWLVTRVKTIFALLIYIFVLLFFFIFSFYIRKVKVR